MLYLKICLTIFALFLFISFTSSAYASQLSTTLTPSVKGNETITETVTDTGYYSSNDCGAAIYFGCHAGYWEASWWVGYDLSPSYMIQITKYNFTINSSNPVTITIDNNPTPAFYFELLFPNGTASYLNYPSNTFISKTSGLAQIISLTGNAYPQVQNFLQSGLWSYNTSVEPIEGTGTFTTSRYFEISSPYTFTISGDVNSLQQDVIPPIIIPAPSSSNSNNAQTSQALSIISTPKSTLSVITPTTKLAIYATQSSYSRGNIIGISGSISPVDYLKTLTLKIFNPDGKVVAQQLQSIPINGQFETSFDTKIANWNESGTYVINAQYGKMILGSSQIVQSTQANTSFSYVVKSLTTTYYPSTPSSLPIKTLTPVQPVTPLKTINTTQPTTPVSIPSWVKNNAKWWASGQLSDDDFVKGMQYLASNNIIHVPSTSVNSQGSQTIPSWIKKNADWWSQGQLSDDDFLKGIQYMVSNGIMKIGPSQNVQDLQQAKQAKIDTLENEKSAK